MITDKLLTIADDTALNTGAAGNYVIGDQIDLQVTANGIGALLGQAALYLVIVVEDAATSGGAATATFSLLTDDDPALGSPNVVASSGTLAVANMTAGTLVAVIPVAPGVAWQRYIGLRQTTGTAAFTAGSINAFFTQSPPARHQYPQNAAITY